MLRGVFPVIHATLTGHAHPSFFFADIQAPREMVLAGRIRAGGLGSGRLSDGDPGFQAGLDGEYTFTG